MNTDEKFLIKLAAALHAAGTPAYRLEDRVQEAGQALSVRVDAFATPTSLFLSFGERTHLLRVEPRPVHLARLVWVDQIAAQVAAGRLNLDQGFRLLKRAEESPAKYPAWAVVTCSGLVSACTAVLFSGTWVEVGVSGGLGLAVGLLQRGLSAPALTRLQEPICALAVAGLATLLARAAPLSVPLVTLAGVIVLLPGLSVTLAINELASRHLASGTARFAGAMVSFLLLGLGAGLGWGIADLLPKALRGARAPIPPEAIPAALAILSLCYMVLLSARKRDGWVIGISAFLAWYAAQEGGALLGPELGACAASLLVGMWGNLQSRLRDVPSLVAHLPGLLVLVPGSLGFSGLRSMLDDDVVKGVDAAFSMLLIASSLVAGLLAAPVLLPGRRDL